MINFNEYVQKLNKEKTIRLISNNIQYVEAKFMFLKMVNDLYLENNLNHLLRSHFRSTQNNSYIFSSSRIFWKSTTGNFAKSH